MRNFLQRLVSPVTVFLVFAALYALTCQTGYNWQDSGTFQYRILHGEVSFDGDLALTHPLYLFVGVLVDRVASLGGMTMRLFATNAMSSIWMALALALFFAAAKRLSGNPVSAFLATMALGFAHMTWWLATITETYAMDVAFMMAEVLLVLKVLQSQDYREAGAKVMLLAFVNGLHFGVGNMALLSLPVLAVFAWTRMSANRASFVALVGLWLVGAFPIIALFGMAIASDGILSATRSLLFGGYGAQTVGFWPSNPKITAFNFAIAALSFWFPALLFVCRRKFISIPAVFKWLLAINALFVARYFVQDQAFFILPTLFLTVLVLVPRLNGLQKAPILAMVIVVVGVMLPIAVCCLAPTSFERGTHPGRSDIKYFSIPWKQSENSCDAYVEANGLEGVWKGYIVH